MFNRTYGAKYLYQIDFDGFIHRQSSAVTVILLQSYYQEFG